MVHLQKKYNNYDIFYKIFKFFLNINIFKNFNVNLIEIIFMDLYLYF